MLWDFQHLHLRLKIKCQMKQEVETSPGNLYLMPRKERERGGREINGDPLGSYTKEKRKSVPLLHLDSLSPASPSSVDSLPSSLTPTFSHQLVSLPTFSFAFLRLQNPFICSIKIPSPLFLNIHLSSSTLHKYRLLFF